MHVLVQSILFQHFTILWMYMFMGILARMVNTMIASSSSVGGLGTLQLYPFCSVYSQCFIETQKNSILLIQMGEQICSSRRHILLHYNLRTSGFVLKNKIFSIFPCQVTVVTIHWPSICRKMLRFDPPSPIWGIYIEPLWSIGGGETLRVRKL